MSNEKRAFYLKDKIVALNNCGECYCHGGRNTYQDPLCEPAGNKEIDTKAKDSFPDFCPLPIWNNIRWYTPVEIAEYFHEIKGDYVEVRVQYDGIIKPRIITKARLSSAANTHNEFMGGKLLKWRPCNV